MKTELSGLIRQMQTIYDGSPWYGESLRQKLQQIDAEASFEQPLPGAYSVAQLVAHILVWRRVLVERIKGNTGYKVALNSPDDWPSPITLQAKGWDKILSELAENQREIMDLLSAETDALLDRSSDGKYSFRALIEGVIQHDLYHTGQIGLVHSLINKNKLSKKV